MESEPLLRPKYQLTKEELLAGKWTREELGPKADPRFQSPDDILKRAQKMVNKNKEEDFPLNPDIITNSNRYQTEKIRIDLENQDLQLDQTDLETEQTVEKYKKEIEAWEQYKKNVEKWKLHVLQMMNGLKEDVDKANQRLSGLQGLRQKLSQKEAEIAQLKNKISRISWKSI